ncbi:hypothetical protein SAMN04515671_2547 [Nakamurella panacisegetis]|uniref:Uncharacterized protein n=1 Tax=Nakamurella panacisegetis TaxID=1090615 RepID=A0A1H0NZ08_9ACTN|nr:hypothetical protein SAMN04515671_2547 [Nakamurella panacisegetis]
MNRRNCRFTELGDSRWSNLWKGTDSLPQERIRTASGKLLAVLLRGDHRSPHGWLRSPFVRHCDAYSPFCLAMMTFATLVGTSAYVLKTIEYEARPAVLDRRSPT